jgi:hypothetical protein
VPEGSNVEIAHTLAEHGGGGRGPRSRARWEEFVEIIEAALLALVAVATAWSGYQAAKWDGLQAERYGEASALRVNADQLLTLGGQQRLLDISTFNTWIQAKTAGQDDLAALYERRFSPEFSVAFAAWLATDPFSNPDAPPGPSFMPEYVNPQIEEGKATNEEASRVFDEGTVARAQAEDYVRTTVVLATVLFLLALSQRFRLRNVRIGVVVVAAALMIYGVVAIASNPRL